MVSTYAIWLIKDTEQVLTIIIGKGTVQVVERSAEANWCSRKPLELDFDSNLSSGPDQLCGLGQVT